MTGGGDTLYCGPYCVGWEGAVLVTLCVMTRNVRGVMYATSVATAGVEGERSPSHRGLSRRLGKGDGERRVAQLVAAVRLGFIAWVR